MKTITNDLGDIAPSYPVENLENPDKILFLDIETTGFTAKSSNLYMIGCAYHENDEWHTIQWLAENYDEEVMVLNAFIEFCLNYSFIIHFNGNRFDLPYITQKCEMYGIPFQFDDFKGVDLYKRIKPYKNFLKLENCKQTTIETFLGVKRDDQYTGGELINFYHDYACSHDEENERLLLLHNKEDLIGMLDLLSVMGISDLFNLPIRVMKVQANYYNDYNNKKRQELVLNLRFLSEIPVPISYSANGCYFTGNGVNGVLKVPLYEEEMKYYYSNYRDYYYLPEEDMAIHKSVAASVDPDHRRQATAATCYTRKVSSYLPQWEPLFTPFFKRSYRDRDYFFELTDEFKTSRKSFNDYAEHVLQNMVIAEDEIR
ncbi:MAG: ribonuclease H-like domain-containing protein [Lachnospiraceae bacterium]|nr:ribonuclease H-like domain-containing protein [Lachnospiraceae bacterium]